MMMKWDCVKNGELKEFLVVDYVTEFFLSN